MANMTVSLHREEATALLAEARREFENAASESYGANDVSQHPALDATTEIIGRLGFLVDHSWPTEDDPWGKQDRWATDIEFSPAVFDWVEGQRASQVGYIEDLDGGANMAEPGYVASQVYLLHVFGRILRAGDSPAEQIAEAA